MLKLHCLSSPVVVQNPNHSLSSQFSSKARVFSANSFGFSPNSSSSRKRLSLKCSQSEYFEQQRLNRPASPNNSSSATQSPAGGTLLYCQSNTKLKEGFWLVIAEKMKDKKI